MTTRVKASDDKSLDSEFAQFHIQRLREWREEQDRDAEMERIALDWLCYIKDSSVL